MVDKNGNVLLDKCSREEIPGKDFVACAHLFDRLLRTIREGDQGSGGEATAFFLQLRHIVLYIIVVCLAKIILVGELNGGYGSRIKVIATRCA